MKRWIGLSALLALVALAGVIAVGAEKEADKEKETKEDPGRSQVDLNDLGTAFQLIEYGRDQEAPEAMVTAAGLLKNVARAKVKPLDAKAIILEDKKEIDDKGKPFDVSKVNLSTESKDLLEEAEILALKQKVNIKTLVRAVKDREIKGEVTSAVYYYGRTLAGGQTLEIPLKVDSKQVVHLALRSNEAVRVSVLTKDGKETLAAATTSAGNLPFKAGSGEAVTRGVVIVRKVAPVRPVAPAVIVRRPAVVVRPGIRLRGVGVGDTEVTLRVYNPTKYAADVELFLD
jgi:hypothetical protein